MGPHLPSCQSRVPGLSARAPCWCWSGGGATYREKYAPRSRSEPTLSPEWLLLCLQYVDLHHVVWVTDARDHIADWMAETRAHIRSIRRAITAQHHLLTRTHRKAIDVNPAAQVHRMLSSDALPTQLYSVIDSRGELTTTAAELEDVMVRHFEHVFAIPPLDPEPLVPPPPEMLFVKPGICPLWFDDLMVEVEEAELLRLVADAPLVSAPGQDEVSTGVWKLAIQGSPAVRQHVLALFSACIRTSTFPAAWKTSVILPFVKDAAKDRNMSNIRPISLQSCLGKLLSKLLARRLGAILQRHPVLNPAQRGFILGGTTMKCIDELLDAWDWSRGAPVGRALYTIFYDIAQAYDSVQVEVLERVMRRLGLPASFTALVVDSLTHLSSCVRTMYGLTRRFAVKRSLRQGDPLAPLLFVILVDALHDGLEVNPFTLQRHGCRLTYPSQTIEVASLGYADDTNVLTNSLADLRVQNEWVQYFMRFNRLRLNPRKCELVGRGADGQPVTEAEVAHHRISIDGLLMTPIAHDQPIRYLGVHSCFDGSCVAQQNKSLQMIMTFTRVATKFRLAISVAVYMLRVFLISRLELALHYVHGPGTESWVRNCDRCLFGCIKHLAGSPLRLSYTALSIALQLPRPSWLEQSIKVSELFLRLNSSDSRWGGLGRAIMRQELPASVDTTTPMPGPNAGSRTTRAAYLAVKRLKCTLHLSEQHRLGSRRQHLFASPAVGSVPSPADCTSSSYVELTCPGGPVRIAHDLWAGWGAGLPPLAQPVHVYTDGSFDPSGAPSTSSWSVVIGDRWLDDNYGSVPSECLMRPSDVGGATLIGASISATQGVYPAELQAIARVLAMLPLSLHLAIHSDSRASIAAISSFTLELNERTRMRMAARTILQLIAHLIGRRQDAGGGVELTHVRAHTDGDDQHSIGNRLADYQANLARQAAHTYPLLLAQLPLERCEPHLHIRSADGRVVIDDLRRSANLCTQQSGLAAWQAQAGGSGGFACAGTIELGRVVLELGSAEQQATYVHAATNSIHHHWVGPDQASSVLVQLQCFATCSAAGTRSLSLTHLAYCRVRPALRFQQQARDAVVAHLSFFPDCASWLGRHSRSPLFDLLEGLFPLAGPSTVQEAIAHPALCLIGAFTRAECTRAVKVLGFIDPEEGRSALDQLRLVCLDQVRRLYAELKVPP